MANSIASFLPNYNSRSTIVSSVTTPIDNFPQLSGTTYSNSGFTFPLELVEEGHKIAEFLKKKNKKSARRVYELIAFTCLNTKSRTCYMKQATLGQKCGHFNPDDAISRRQVIRIEHILRALKLYKGDQPRTDFSFDRFLTPLGTVTYLILTNRLKFKPFKRCHIVKPLCVASQFKNQEGNIYLNYNLHLDNDFANKEEKRAFISKNLGQELGIDLESLDKKYQFDVKTHSQIKENRMKGVNALAMCRAALKRGG